MQRTFVANGEIDHDVQFLPVYHFEIAHHEQFILFSQCLNMSSV